MDLFQLERITSNRINWKPGQKEKIVELYSQGTSINQLGKMFNGLHYNTIKKILIEYNIPLRTRAQSHYTDHRKEDIFKKIDSEEKAYWLGFLAADGCVAGNYIKIGLQEKDVTHLEKLKHFLQADSIKILTFTKQNKYEIGTYCSFSIGCKEMANDLKALGVVENKSLILKPPIGLIPEKFYLDWIRGYFDGDGGLSYSEKDNRWQSYANSTKEVLEWIVQMLELNTKPFNQQHYGKKDNVWRIHFNGRINVYKAWNKMYHNDTATIFLDRKHDKYLQLCSSFK